jgi:hypothetical protein
MSKNLFDGAKKQTSIKTTKIKEEKTKIEIEDPEFFEKIKNLEEIQSKIKSAKTKADILSDDIKIIGKNEWCKLYTKINKNPGTVILEQVIDNDIAQAMFVPSDKYKTITQEKAEELCEIYGDNIIEEKTIFSFNNEIIEKYGEILSNLIENCPEIENEDKEKIIIATTTFSISEGTIDKFSDYTNDIHNIMEDVCPVYSLKNIKIISE